MGLGLSAWNVMIAALVASTALLLVRGSSSVTHWIRRAGYDPERRLAFVIGIVRALLIVAATAVCVQSLLPLLRGLPSTVGLLLGVGALLAAFPILQNVLAGLYLILRNDLRAGDRIRVADVEGMVREVGLTRVRVRKDDETVVVIPNRTLLLRPFEVRRASGSARIITVLQDRPYTSEDVPRARQRAYLCPYRIASSPIRVEVQSGDLHVEIQAWRPRCHEEVRAYFQSVLSVAE